MADVVVYSSDTCPYCALVKEYLSKKGVSYTEKNVSQDANARKELVRKGYMGVPVVIIDGEEIVGFDQQKIDELLNI
jgi:glutaredoxin 3